MKPNILTTEITESTENKSKSFFSVFCDLCGEFCFPFYSPFAIAARTVFAMPPNVNV
jgi:hypothetical protein